ncbi:MAG: selenocysteine-specific translation elongation factor [Deltaproteobacteria bacterium CG23_combo_of_CG06-09_8_20_14_all_60_8]|nr:MAG: selenocysteine-specific translation elongation factor [Desulfobacterales bacterium CG2_30_60_27]PIP43139.1 MAG: selenocysteine-specific translation elongation factor [Deltaproteobacteria bacterium CG23_combo_of_CG06-09_8_20_14_all_60_8]
MRELILGTAGHVDHGKTSLVKALTGINTDRLKEEQARGITIELGFAFLDLPCGHRLGIVDVPGHERFVKNMVAGAAGIDLVAFVVAADEGIMPQTLEHFEICRLLGVKRGLVVITKKDMVEPDWLDLVQEELHDFLADSFLANAPMVAVSSVTGEGIDEVKNVLNQLVAASDFSEAFGPFRLPIDRIFSMKGFGSVVTGTSISGRLKVGQPIAVFPAQLPGKVRGLQVHGRDVEEVEAGVRTAVNIQGIDKEMIGRGDVVATPGCLQPSYMLDAEFFYLSGNTKPLKNRTRVRVHLGTAEVMGRAVLLEDEELAPGAAANVQLLLESPVCAWPGDRYVVRSYSPVHTIGGGGIFNGTPVRKRRRFKPANEELFRVYRQGTVEDLALLHIRESGPAGLTQDALAARIGLFGKRLDKLLQAPLSGRRLILVDAERRLLVDADVVAALEDQALALLGEYHTNNPMKAGFSKEELRSRLPEAMAPRLFQMVLQEMVGKGAMVREESLVRLAGHAVSLAADAGLLRIGMERLFLEAGLQPPITNEITAAFAKYDPKLVRQILEVLVQEKVVVKVSESLYFHHQALDAVAAKVVALLKSQGEMDAQAFKGLAGLSRKFSIPILEYLDKQKITIRVGDKRVLRERQ